QLLVEEQIQIIAEQIGPPSEVTEAVVSGERPPVLVVMGDWPKGISGLLATKLVDLYGLPAFVGTDTGAETLAVSARGVPGIGKGPVRARVAQAGAYRDAVWFRAPKEFLTLGTGATVDLVCHLQVDDWQGLQRPELRVRDWRPGPPLFPSQ